MTREEARQAAEVMMAYADGKDIEFFIKGKPYWGKCVNPIFDWESCKYRIKQKPTYRPFKDKEECWAEMQKHKPFGWVTDKTTKTYQSITSVNDLYVNFSSQSGLYYDQMLEYMTFADGTPFGIKEE